MCVIIDANVAAEVFRSPAAEEWRPVIDWLLGGDGGTVYGGLHGEELFKVERVRRLLTQLNRAGKAIWVDSRRMAEEEDWLRTQELRSNDPHVLALARASGARTLCSRDRELHKDFKNPALVNDPRGSVYQNPSHRHLLGHTSGCPRGKSR